MVQFADTGQCLAVVEYTFVGGGVADLADQVKLGVNGRAGE